MANLKFCIYCGGDIPTVATFCSHCGREQLEAAAAGTATRAEPAAAIPIGPTADQRATIGPPNRDGNTAALMVGGALISIGSFLPWVTAYTGFGSIGRSGIEGGGDGVITLIAGLGILILGSSRFFGYSQPTAWRFAPPLLAGLITLAIVIVDYLGIEERVRSIEAEGGGASVGMGLYAVGIGAAATILAAWANRKAADPRPLRRDGNAGWWQILESPLWKRGRVVLLTLRERDLVFGRGANKDVASYPLADILITSERPKELTVMYEGALVGRFRSQRAAADVSSVLERYRASRQAELAGKLPVIDSE